MAHQRRRPARFRLPQILILVFVAVLALLGGASRADEIAQTAVRLAAITMIAILVAVPDRPLDRAVVPPLIGLAVAAVLIAVQLLPLPYAWWTAMPGRDLYREATELAGLPGAWRPWSLSPDRTWNALLGLVVPLAMLLILGRLRQGERLALAPVILLVVALSAGAMMLQMTGILSISPYFRTGNEAAVGLFANRNHQALLLAIGLPLAANWATENQLSSVAPALRLWIALACIAVFMILIPATGSRTGLVLGGIGLFMAGVIAWEPGREALGRIRSRRRRRQVTTAAAIGAAALMIVAFSFSRAVGVQRLLKLDVVADTRSRLLPRVLEMAETFFPFGSGYGTFDPAFRRFERLDELKMTFFNEAHNDYLQIVTEGGLLGGLAALAALAVLARRAATAWRGPGDRTTTRIARLSSVLILLVLVASAVDYPLRTPLGMALLALFATWLSQRVEAPATGAPAADEPLTGAPAERRHALPS